MGGPTSGNYGGRPTVEDGLVLDINRLIRQGTFQPDRVCGATISYQAHMLGERGWARLYYTTTDYWSGEKTQHDYRVELVTTSQPFGGRRWWWICPRRGDLVSKLYKPNGGSLF